MAAKIAGRCGTETAAVGGIAEWITTGVRQVFNVAAIRNKICPTFVINTMYYSAVLAQKYPPVKQ